jgi:lysophospholipase L1-like esterase
MTVIQLIGGALYQWDTDRQVILHPHSGYTVDEVHFMNPNGTTAFVVEPTEKDGVIVGNIPNILLQSAVNIRVFAVMHTKDGERTTCDCTFGVIPRQKPADYVYTETEVKTYEALKNQLVTIENEIVTVKENLMVHKAEIETVKEQTNDKVGLNFGSIISSCANLDNFIGEIVKQDSFKKTYRFKLGVNLAAICGVTAYDLCVGWLSEEADSSNNAIYVLYFTVMNKGLNFRYVVGTNEITPCSNLIDKVGLFEANTIEGALIEIANKIKSVWAGKKALFFGDSLTEVNYHYTKGYHQWVKEILGLSSYQNFGRSGYTLANIYDKVCSVNSYADIIFIMGGVNDQTKHVPLGNISDTTTGTTYGSLNLLCAKLKEKHPTTTIVFITPHYQTKYPHNEGITSYEISKAIKEVCEKYAIPVYDNFSFSGIFQSNFSAFTTDNCHWNDTAHELVGKNLAEFINNNFKYVCGYIPVWVGKTVTVEKNFNSTVKSIHMTALLEVDADIVKGAVVTATLAGENCVNMISNTSKAGQLYLDTSGAVDNGSYAGAASATVNHTVEISDNNKLSYTVENRTISATVSTPYIKVPFVIFGDVPYSFKITDISVKVNGIEKPIVALGAFFASSKEILTVS